MGRLDRIAARTLGWSRWARFTGTFALLLSALLIRLAVLGFEQGYPYLTFFVAILTSAVLFGGWSGLIATVVSTITAVWLFVPPYGPWIADPREVVAALVFFATGLTLVWLTSAARSAMRERDEASKAIRLERERLRSVLNSLGEPFYAVDSDWRIVHVSRAALDIWKRPAEAVLGRTVLDVFPQAMGSKPYEGLQRVMRTRQAEHMEAVSGVTKRWVSVDIYPAEGGGLLVAFRDIQGRKLAEERQHLLVGELTHRIKNTLALVQAIAEQTRRTVTSPDAFHTIFADRLGALARAHDALRRDGGTETTLEAVAREALAPYLGGASPRLDIIGPHVRLSSGTAVALGMAFHELATNAAKHGALVSPAGRVRVSWRAAGGSDDGRHWYDLLWEEIGGPPVTPPADRRGFGMRLLERGLPAQIGGEVSIEFATTGLVCRIRVPEAEDGDASMRSHTTDRAADLTSASLSRPEA
jgi:PAS domain S-box-containing protein